MHRASIIAKSWAKSSSKTQIEPQLRTQKACRHYTVAQLYLFVLDDKITLPEDPDDLDDDWKKSDGKKGFYLDKDGNPVNKGSDASHILPGTEVCLPSTSTENV